MTELHRLDNNRRVKVISPEIVPPGGRPAESKEYNFYHIDGMYSYCTDDNGNVCHLVAWQDVEDLGPLTKTK